MLSVFDGHYFFLITVSTSLVKLQLDPANSNSTFSDRISRYLKLKNYLPWICPLVIYFELLCFSRRPRIPTSGVQLCFDFAQLLPWDQIYGVVSF